MISPVSRGVAAVPGGRLMMRWLVRWIRSAHDQPARASSARETRAIGRSLLLRSLRPHRQPRLAILPAQTAVCVSSGWRDGERYARCVGDS